MGDVWFPFSLEPHLSHFTCFTRDERRSREPPPGHHPDLPSKPRRGARTGVPRRLFITRSGAPGLPGLCTPGRRREGSHVSDTSDLLQADRADGAQAADVTTSNGSNGGTARKRKPAGLPSMVLPELQSLASQLGISGTGRMRKSELIAAI